MLQKSLTTTLLPNDIGDNPFDALCYHGVSSSEVMTWLILVLEAGYVSKAFHIGIEKTIIRRMPAHKGFHL